MNYRVFTVTVIGPERDEIEDVDGSFSLEDGRLILEELVRRRSKETSGVQVAVADSGELAVLFPHARGDGHLVGTVSGRTANFRVLAFKPGGKNDFVLLDDTELNFPSVK